jgi:ribosomal protein S18 acetylase RimI-like enzyme
MNDTLEIEAVSAATEEIIESLRRLIPQLSSSASLPTTEQIREIADSPCTELLIARDRNRDGRIVGSLTLAVFRIPTGVRAWIEDVVVDSGARGRGVGEALNREALRIAASRGARTVELTSRPSRESANRLYQRLGFAVRETNLYRYSFPEAGKTP